MQVLKKNLINFVCKLTTKNEFSNNLKVFISIFSFLKYTIVN